MSLIRFVINRPVFLELARNIHMDCRVYFHMNLFKIMFISFLNYFNFLFSWHVRK